MLVTVCGMRIGIAHEPPAITGLPLTVAGLTFTIPAKWQAETPATPARAGQWHLAPHGPAGETAELILFYFGAHAGGSAQENIDGWIDTVSTGDGHPAAAEVKTRNVNGLKISQVVLFGTYNEPQAIAGIPPQPRTHFGLVGVVVDTPQGNLYWQLTGPEALITAHLPLLNKMIDSVHPAAK